MTVTHPTPVIRDVFAHACPGTRVREVAELATGHTSRQWVLDTDEGPLLLKIPVRNTDPEHLRNLIAATRIAAELDVPVSRYRAFVPWVESVRSPVLVQEYVPGQPATQRWQDLPEQVRVDAAATLGRWVAALHTRRATVLVDALGSRAHASASHAVDEALTRALAALRTAGVDHDFTTVRDRIERAAAEVGEVVPTFCHHDVYLDNVLLAGGRPVRLLDFEHARYSDQFAEFGKIRDLLFDWYPETEDPFMAEYRQVHPIDAAEEHRLNLHIGLYNVVMCGYFSRWQPSLVPVYLNRINSWLGV